MSLFGRIKDSIFGKSETSSSQGGQVTTSIPEAVAAISSVDVEAILTGLAAKSGQPSNWKTSIVDLMKLLGMDSSLTERVSLAKELG